jgi:hypothetical protein
MPVALQLGSLFLLLGQPAQPGKLYQVEGRYWRCPDQYYLLQLRYTWQCRYPAAVSGGIEWNVYGKISQITKTNSGVTTVIKYTYDATGNRIGKWVQVGAGTPKQTAYVRDASGNVMAIYEKGNSEVNGGLLSQIEVPLYGSSRLGVWRPDREVETTGWELFDTDPMTGTGGGIAGGWERGRVQFELSNHLGNVLVTISDVRIPVLMPEGIELCDDPVHPACYRPIDYYLPQVLTANDYYPFGMGMPGRKYSEGEYRYGFNGQEKSTEIDPTGNSMTAEFWQYDARIGRRWNVDPEQLEYESPYAINRNNPVVISDSEGDWPGLGFLVGIITEFVVQTIEIKVGIRNEYNIKQMVVSGFATQMGLGVSKQINRIRNIGKYTKAFLNLSKDVIINSGEQYLNEGKFSFKDALINAGVSKVAGDFVEGQLKKSGKYIKLNKKAIHKEGRVAKHKSYTRINEANKARDAAENYLIEEATIASVPATSAVTRTIEAVTKPNENKQEDINNNWSLINTNIKTTTTIPSLKGLNRYISTLHKLHGDKIESITYNVIDENSVGITIKWKEGGGVLATAYDKRSSDNRIPAPPPKQ